MTVTSVPKRLNTLANDLSSFMTTEEFQSWLAAHAHDLDGYMTQTEFQAWLLELAEDLSEYLGLTWALPETANAAANGRSVEVDGSPSEPGNQPGAGELTPYDS